MNLEDLPTHGAGEESGAAADQVRLQKFDQAIEFNLGSFYTNFRTLKEPGKVGVSQFWTKE